MQASALNTTVLLRTAVAILGAAGIVLLLFVELPKANASDDLYNFITTHDPARLISDFAKSLISFSLSLTFAVFLAMINCVDFLQRILESGQGHILLMIILGSSGGICLVMAWFKVPNPEWQTALMSAGTGALGMAFGFLQGFNLRSGERDQTRAGKKRAGKKNDDPPDKRPP